MLQQRSQIKFGGRVKFSGEVGAKRTVGSDYLIGLFMDEGQVIGDHIKVIPLESHAAIHFTLGEKKNAIPKCEDLLQL
jgi:hypothetical protein